MLGRFWDRDLKFQLRSVFFLFLYLTIGNVRLTSCGKGSTTFLLKVAWVTSIKLYIVRFSLRKVRLCRPTDKKVILFCVYLY